MRSTQPNTPTPTPTRVALIAVMTALSLTIPFGTARAETKHKAKGETKTKSAPSATTHAEGWRPLFDGVKLDGWQTARPELWTVEDGCIVGRSPGIKENEFLFTKEAHGDFELRYDVKLTLDDGNSGVQIRSERLPDGHAKGYQVDVGKGYWGSLYHELGRGMLAAFKREEGKPGDPIKLGEFNRFEVTARGHHITIKVNGVKTVDLEDPEGELTGLIALQIHSGGPLEVRFRNIEIRAIAGTKK